MLIIVRGFRRFLLQFSSDSLDFFVPKRNQRSLHICYVTVTIVPNVAFAVDSVLSFLKSGNHPA